MQKILIVEDDLAIQAILHDFIQDSCKEPKSKVCTKRDTSLQSKYTSRVKALIKTYVEIERKYPK